MGGKGKRKGVGYSSLFPASPRKRENAGGAGEKEGLRPVQMPNFS